MLAVVQSCDHLKKDLLFIATDKEVLEQEGYRNVLWSGSEGINFKHAKMEMETNFQEL